MKSAQKKSNSISIQKGVKDDSIMVPLKKGILGCCCYCTVFRLVLTASRTSSARRSALLTKGGQASGTKQSCYLAQDRINHGTLFLISLILSVMILSPSWCDFSFGSSTCIVIQPEILY